MLHEFHAGLGATFAAVNGAEAVAHFGDVPAEYAALTQSVGVLDLSFRGRVCLLGNDRVAFLHGQVTNDVKALKPGEGCYAALISAKGRMQSDLNVHRLDDELLLNFEPGLTTAVTERLDKFIIAADVQIVDVAPHYGLLSAQGPRSRGAVEALGLGGPLPERLSSIAKLSDPTVGDIYVANQPRLGSAGFDLFVPTNSLGAVADKLITATRRCGGRACGWEAFETARIEAGIPRFGADMDENTLPPEAGLDTHAVSYTKGCYIGQEVLNRIRTYGQVAKALRRLRLADDLPALPMKGDKLFKDGKAVGLITSATRSPALNANVALGYVRRECNQPGTVLRLHTAASQSDARIMEPPAP